MTLICLNISSIYADEEVFTVPEDFEWFEGEIGRSNVELVYQPSFVTKDKVTYFVNSDDGGNIYSMMLKLGIMYQAMNLK